MDMLIPVDRAIELAEAEATAWGESLAGWATAEAARGDGVYSANDKHLRVLGDQLKAAFSLLGLPDPARFDRPAPVMDGAGEAIEDGANAIEAVKALQVGRETFAAARNVEWLAAMRANIEAARACIEVARERRDAIAALVA
jgi:hypothetical protein